MCFVIFFDYPTPPHFLPTPSFLSSSFFSPSRHRDCCVAYIFFYLQCPPPTPPPPHFPPLPSTTSKKKQKKSRICPPPFGRGMHCFATTSFFSKTPSRPPTPPTPRPHTHRPTSPTPTHKPSLFEQACGSNLRNNNKSTRPSPLPPCFPLFFRLCLSQPPQQQVCVCVTK